MWLGPPYMKRKMTLFAFAACIGFFAAIGFRPATSSAAWTIGAKPSRPRRPVSANPVKAPPVCQKNSRRVRPQN